MLIRDAPKCPCHNSLMSQSLPGLYSLNSLAIQAAALWIHSLVLCVQAMGTCRFRKGLGCIWHWRVVLSRGGVQVGSQGGICQDTKQGLPPWVPQPDPWVPSQVACGSGVSVGTVFVLSFLPQLTPLHLACSAPCNSHASILEGKISEGFVLFKSDRDSAGTWNVSAFPWL